LNAFAARAAATLGKLTSKLQLSDQRLSSLNSQRPLALALWSRLDHGFRIIDATAIKFIAAKFLRDELALRGIRSLTNDESEEIAARIFERITDLELELAARDFNTSTSRVDKP
jgi:hypothetical protein